MRLHGDALLELHAQSAAHGAPEALEEALVSEEEAHDPDEDSEWRFPELERVWNLLERCSTGDFLEAVAGHAHLILDIDIVPARFGPHYVLEIRERVGG